jgi:predicted transcriptional regulator
MVTAQESMDYIVSLDTVIGCDRLPNMAKKPTNDKSIGMRISSQDYETLERIGGKIERSVSWLIRTAIREYIERQK